MSESSKTEVPLYFCEGPWTLEKILEVAREKFPEVSHEELMRRIVLVPAPVVWMKIVPP